MPVPGIDIGTEVTPRFGGGLASVMAIKTVEDSVGTLHWIQTWNIDAWSSGDLPGYGNFALPSAYFRLLARELKREERKGLARRARHSRAVSSLATQTDVSSDLASLGTGLARLPSLIQSGSGPDPD